MLVYEFTLGVHATGAGTPWDTARTGVVQRAAPTTRQGIYDALVTALEAIGFTRFERPPIANVLRADVWFSRGEAGDRIICFQTLMRDLSVSGQRYLFFDVGPKLTEGATALTGTWTWDGTTTVLATDTSQVRIGSFIRADSDGQWFEVTAVNANVSVTIAAGGFTIPNAGATASSYRTPTLGAAIGAGLPTGSAGQARDRWDFGASDFTADFQIVGDLDGVWFDFRNNGTNVKFMAFVGNLATFDVNANVMIADASVVAGDFVEILTVDETGASVDPRVLGYRPLDAVQIVNVDPASGAEAETQQIVSVQSDRIVVRRLRNNYAGENSAVNPRVDGARIGMRPVPICRIVLNNLELQGTSNLANGLTTPFDHDGGVLDRQGQAPFPDGDLIFNSQPSGEENHELMYALGNAHAADGEYGEGTTGNDRTLRFTIRSVAAVAHDALPNNSASRGFSGKIPFLASYNGSVTLYTHDNMLRDRASPQEDFVPFRFTSTSGLFYVLGPTPGP